MYWAFFAKSEICMITGKTENYRHIENFLEPPSPLPDAPLLSPPPSKQFEKILFPKKRFGRCHYD